MPIILAEESGYIGPKHLLFSETKLHHVTIRRTQILILNSIERKLLFIFAVPVPVAARDARMH